MKVADIMTRELHTAAPDWTVWEAMKVMKEQRIRHLPVVDDGLVLGIISERDLRDECVPPLVGIVARDQADDMLDQTLDAVLREDIITITPDTSLQAATRIFIEQRIGALLVVNDDDDTLAGILSVIDVLQAALPHLP